MSVLSGAYAPRPRQGAPSIITPDLARHSGQFAAAAAFTVFTLFGAKSANSPGTAPPRLARSGAIATTFGNEIFEKIIVVPRVKDVGFILSEQQFPVEVWNSFKRSQKTVTAITVSGGGGLSIVNPYGLPLALGPQGSRVMTGVMPGSGPPSANNVATFTVAGATGTEMTVTGTRLLVYAVDIDWTNGFDEALGWLTDVLAGPDDTEQRVQNIYPDPRFSCKYRSMTMSARESAQLMSKLWGWQTRVFGVPWWKDETELTGDIAAGAMVIPCDTTYRPGLAAGMTMILFRDFNTWEALQIHDVTASTITLEVATLKDWKAGDLAIPIRLARMMKLSPLYDMHRDLYVYDSVFEGELT